MVELMSMGTEKFDPHHERKYARFLHKKSSQTLIIVCELFCEVFWEVICEKNSLFL